MAIFFSDFFEVSPDLIDEYGAFNISLINDLPLFVDPFLLFNSESPTYKELHEDIIRYMRFLKEMSLSSPINPHLVDAWFTFPEVKQNWLGFSKKGNGGQGLGEKFAKALNRNLNSVFRNFGEETITRSSHLEKLCLVREGVGRDNISDFTTNLIKNFLATYTQEFVLNNLSKSQIKLVRINKVKFNYTTRSWISANFQLPYINGDYVLLTPKDILTKDESWINRPELLELFQEIAHGLPNGVLRAQVNEYLLRVLPNDSKAKKEEIQAAINLAVDKFPDVIDYYIRLKEEEGNKAVSIAEERVAEVKSLFVEQISRLVNEYLKPIGFYQSPGNTYFEAKERILLLKDVVENKGGYKFFYVNDKPLKLEKDLQLFYRLIWFSTAYDVSRELSDECESVDFKALHSKTEKTLVEFKLGKNPQLESYLAKQCENHENSSELTHCSLKVILYFTEDELAKTNRILERLDLKNSPHIILINACDNKPPDHLSNFQFHSELINGDTVNAGKIGDDIWNIRMAQQQMPSDNPTQSQSQRQRSLSEKDSLEKAYTLQSQKVANLRTAFLIETDVTRKFQYEQQLQAEERTLKELVDKLDAIEQQLQASNFSHSKQEDKQKQLQKELEQEREKLKYEKEIFISYAWGGDSETYVNHLDEVLQSKGIAIIRDKRDLGYKGLIKAFMEKIGRGKCVIAVISDKYLKSPNCMFELVQIAKNGNFYDRIFPIVLPDVQIYKPIERIKYIKYWEEQIKELDEAMKGVSAANLQGFREEIDLYTQIRHTIAELTNLLKDMNTLTPDIHSESDFDELSKAIAQRLDE
ncbi:MAG: TIR domain-containing protein [Nostoc sp. EkiNYC01]|nr:TIR domain-containing protein [Nostoc sp. EkiNYC01]